jgi:triacylglycerol esterase/lipase EstA (alpha/beta hydrolase family)
MAAFILVHGTWHKAEAQSSWLKDGSPLRGTLAQACSNSGDDRAYFEPVRWSGRLPFRHRVVASRLIAERVKQLKKRLPGEPIILVGHSHGGSAIAYFLNAHRKSEDIAGCAFL